MLKKKKLIDFAKDLRQNNVSLQNYGFGGIERATSRILADMDQREMKRQQSELEKERKMEERMMSEGTFKFLELSSTNNQAISLSITI